MLRNSPEPIVINILGSCRDVAIAGSLEPELFAEKCKAIYLNAGSGSPDPKKAAKLEWNVQLDPRAYSTIFSIPCPVYWMPCFEEIGWKPTATSKFPEYGTYYRFRQGTILPHLSKEMQNFFAFMFKHGQLEKEHTTGDDIRGLAEFASWTLRFETARKTECNGPKYVVHGRIPARGRLHGDAGWKDRPPGGSQRSRIHFRFD